MKNAKTKQAREAENLRRMATVVRDSNDAITIQDFEGRITAWNRGAELMYGHSEAEALLMNIERLTTPGKVAEQKEFIRRLVAGKAITSFETQRLTKDGRVLDVWMTVTKLMDDAGNPIGLASTERDITERKRAQAATQESEEKYRNLFNNAEVGMFRTRLDGSEVLEFNERYLEILGYTSEEIKGKPSRDLWADKRERDKMVKRLNAEGHVIDLECDLLNKKGEVKRCVTSLRLYRDRGILEGSILDITARKRAEDKLHASEARFKRLVESTTNYIFTVEVENGRALSTTHSPGSIATTGYSPEDYEADPYLWCRMIPEPDRETVIARINDLLAGGKAQTLEHRIIHKDGSVRWVSDTLVPKYDASRLVGYDGLVVDITERRRSEEDLKRLFHKTSLILNSAGEGIYGVDLEGKVTFINPAAAQMLGYDAEELLGRESHATWHHSYPDGTSFPVEQCRLHDALRTGIPCLTSSVMFWRKDGTKFPVDCNSTPLFEAGELAGAVVNFRDISEKTLLESQLRQALKMEAVGALAGGVAHDFNNLTAIVLGYGEMLLGQLCPEDPARKSVEQILEAGRRSASLTRQLLAFSRKQPLQPVVLDLNALLRNLEKMLGRIVGEDLQLELKLAAELGRVTADPGQIEQVVTNLTVNAHDAMPQGGRLTIETADVELDETAAPGHGSVIPGRYVLLALTDTGCGMDQATLARVYEPFFTTKEKGKGTGLGLATAYGIVKQSGGYIWAYSEPGQGTSFKIYLPRTDAQPLATAVDAGGETPRGSGERILLVEDEAALRKLCEIVLSGLGYRVSAAKSGPEALLLVEAQGLKPDLVVTDVVMPGMSGSEMAERLRKNQPGLRVLYISGYPDEVIAHHGVLNPGISKLQKPFTERALAVKVREVLGEKPAAARPGRRVLMIDDDEQFRDLVQHFCRKRGHVFAGVDSAALAIAALAGQPFDVLLVDRNIPGTSGEHILREIRAAGHATPAIVLTGDVASADMDVLRPLGVVRALEKSSNAEPLLRAIEEEDLA